jgi:hypothetical protein
VSFIDSEIKENKKQSLKVLVPKEDSGNINVEFIFLIGSICFLSGLLIVLRNAYTKQ